MTDAELETIRQRWECVGNRQGHDTMILVDEIADLKRQLANEGTHSNYLQLQLEEMGAKLDTAREREKRLRATLDFLRVYPMHKKALEMIERALHESESANGY